ncbi:MAG: DUF5057 domain-containing protein [Lachnospiraceae bacterium]|nr:DUF5057 domain-containing protein [Lachnospiraceae bacterium]
MKNKSSLTVFDMINKKKKRFISLVLVILVVVSTCFSNAPFVSEAEEGESNSGQESTGYFDQVIAEMKADPNRTFNILEIVPDDCCGEFLFYTADSSIQEKFDYISTDAAGMEEIYSKLSDGAKNDVKTTGSGQLTNMGFSNFLVMYHENLFTNKVYLEIENLFLNEVVPDYATFLDGRLDVDLVEANKLTIDDISNADLIYINTRDHDGGTVEGYEFLSQYKKDASGNWYKGAKENLVVYKKDGSGNFTKSDAASGNIPGYTTYEYVTYGSAEDIASRYTGDNPAYTIYKDSDNKGYYISRDISWESAAKILEVTLKGKSVNGKTAQVPIIFDASTIGTNGNNIYRLEAIIRSVEADVAADEKYQITNSAGEVCNGYAIVENMISTNYAVYNEYGVKTAVLSSEYYADHTADSKAANGADIIKDCKNTVTNFVTDADWGNYLAYLYQGVQYDHSGNSSENIQYKIQSDTNPDGSLKYYNTLVQENWTYDLTFIKDNQDFRSRNMYLDRHYYCFNGDSSLIPSNYANGITVANASNLLGIADGQYTVIDILRYLLGVSDGEYSGRKGGIYLKVLEIEPTTDFVFDTEESIKTLAKDIGIDESKLISKSSLTPNADGTYTVPAGKYVIDVDCYSTNAVNALNNSFVETYDIIYVGDNIGNLNTMNGSTVYNDTSLNGYVYLAYGDLVKVNDVLMGMLTTDFETDSEGNYRYQSGTSNRYLKNVYTEVVSYCDANGYNNANMYKVTAGNARYPDNDLTEYKMNELIEFAQAGNIVLLGNKLYQPSFTYPTSHMRNMIRTISEDASLKYTVVRYTPSTSSSTYTKARNVINIYRNLNPVIKSVSVMHGSDEIGDISYNGGIVVPQITVDKNNPTETNLQFKATIDNVDINKNYKVLVVIDKNGDGIFNEVQSTNDGNEAYDPKVLTGSEIMSNGVTINVTLDKGYSGVFIWKLLITEEDTTKNIRSEVSGSIAIKGVDKNIEVLQIVPASTSTTLLMAYYDETTGNSIHIKDLATKNKAKYVTTPGLYDNMTTCSSTYPFEELLWETYKSIGYKIQVTAMTPALFNEEYGNLQDYDMLVIGFGDMYAKADVSKDAANAIEEFINSGKAVLFSHDTVAFSVLRADEYKTTKPKQSASAGIGKVYEGAYASGYSSSGSKSTAGGYWSGNISTRFRSLVGMDRYNVSSYNLDSSDTNTEPKNVPKDADGNSITEIQGISTGTLLRYAFVRDGLVWSGDTGNMSKNLYNWAPYNGNFSTAMTSNLTTTKVSSINVGQVTQYPYNIDKEITVATTHTQYFQLDLEMPTVTEGGITTEDPDNKVMVWYTLGSNNATSGYYYYTKGDAANNFYIYSKANITYTGAGHSDMIDENTSAITAGNEAELKLFVNTIVKAITAGNFTPRITVTNAQKSSGRNHIYIYEYMADSDYHIDFYAQDDDLVTGSGKFKSAKITWTPDGATDAVTLIDYGNTLVCGTARTFNVQDAKSSIGDASYAQLISEIKGGTADLTIEVTDGRGAKAIENVTFSMRNLFALD